MARRKETIDEQLARIRREAAEKRAIIEAAQKRIVPITLDLGKDAYCISTRRPYKLVDEFLAVVDAREDLEGAMRTARALILDPKIQAVAMVRGSQTLTKSFQKLEKFFGHEKQYEQSPKGLHVLPWLQKNKHLYIQESTLFKDKIKQIGFWRSAWSLGSDFDEISRTARIVFPENLSWSIRRAESSEPGHLHYDDFYRPGKNTLLDLPRSFLKSVNKEEFEPLPGNTTLIYALSHGPLVCKTDDMQPYQNFYFDENNQTAYQAQDGDLLLMRGRWGSDYPDFNPVFHCSPVIDDGDRQRFVALASSNYSYLAPQVREFLGRSRLPINNPFERLYNDLYYVERFFDDLDKIQHDVEPRLVEKFFRETQQESPKIIRKLQQMNDPRIARMRQANINNRFPEETLERVLPFLDAA